MVSKKSIDSLVKQRDLTRLKGFIIANKKALTTLYFFSINDVELNHLKISGVYYNDENELLEKKLFPIPDVIFIKSNDMKKLKDLSEIFQKRQSEQKTILINYLNVFNKWDVYLNLSKFNDFKLHLPFTIIYQSPNDLRKMLTLNDNIYLKACIGGRGKQVIRISKIQKHKYKYKYVLSYYRSKLYREVVTGFNNLNRKVLDFYKNKKFIIQQAIDLITINNKIVDLRAEVQRNGNGDITITAIPVRVGKIKSPITTHNKSYTFDYFFSTLLNYSNEEINDLKLRLNKFLINAYSSIEDIYGPVGDIGIDVGLDKKGRLWFIECNSRSLKVSLFKAYDEETINQSFLNILEYAKYRYHKGV